MIVRVYPKYFFICSTGGLTESPAIPLSIFIAVTSVCVVCCILAVILTCLCLRRRQQRNNGSLASKALLWTFWCSSIIHYNFISSSQCQRLWCLILHISAKNVLIILGICEDGHCTIDIATVKYNYSDAKDNSHMCVHIWLVFPCNTVE